MSEHPELTSERIQRLDYLGLGELKAGTRKVSPTLEFDTISYDHQGRVLDLGVSAARDLGLRAESIGRQEVVIAGILAGQKNNTMFLVRFRNEENLPSLPVRDLLGHVSRFSPRTVTEVRYDVISGAGDEILERRVGQAVEGYFNEKQIAVEKLAEEIRQVRHLQPGVSRGQIPMVVLKLPGITERSQGTTSPTLTVVIY